MAEKKVSILGVPFVRLTKKELVRQLDERIQTGQKAFVVTANPEIVMKANEDRNYMDTIRQADYITADGIGIVKAAQILGDPLPERVAGFDTLVDLLQLADQKRYSIYLLGAAEEVLEKTVANIQKDYPNVNIAGFHNGFFDWENNSIDEEIQSRKPDLIFVALGLPRQENWISQNLHKFEKGVFMGVGGSFDVLAGAVQRAPEFWQKVNLEWFYRLLKQPSRWRRMLVLPKFALIILSKKVKGQA